MGNAGLDEAQTGIKIARRNISNLRCADDTTLMAESGEELKSLLMKVKEESETDGLKLNIQKTKIIASSPITSWEIDGETMETMRDFILGGGSKITAWKIPWTEEPGRLQSMGSLRVVHDLVTSFSLFTFMHWRRRWHPTPVFLLENPMDRGAW